MAVAFRVSVFRVSAFRLEVGRARTFESELNLPGNPKSGLLSFGHGRNASI
jgi:hypothetical protein